MGKYDRTISLIGESKFNKLQNQKILIAGLGGVGGYTLEALSRSGINNFIIIDFDVVDETNINRQLIADETTIGKYKVDCFVDRINKIDSSIKVDSYKIKIDENTINAINFTNVSYIIDCIDDVNAKILLIKKAKELDIPIISSMGTAKKLDPYKFKIADISKTDTCPLAKAVRLKLRELNINHVKVLYSNEIPTPTLGLGSISTIPSIAGLLIANEVIKDIIKD